MEGEVTRQVSTGSHETKRPNRSNTSVEFKGRNLALTSEQLWNRGGGGSRFNGRVRSQRRSEYKCQVGSRPPPPAWLAWTPLGTDAGWWQVVTESCPRYHFVARVLITAFDPEQSVSPSQ